MRNVLRLLALAPWLLTAAQGALSVGPAGSGTISFSNRPPASEWATRSISGNEGSFGTALALLEAAQTNSATDISAPLLDAGPVSPAAQATLASWSSAEGGAIWTRPAGNGATLLMASLQNNTGTDQSVLGISYALGQSGITPAEQIPGHQVFYSLSGAPGTWVNIPALSGGGIGVRSHIVSLAAVWANGSTLHVLWVDDNTPGGVDRGYSIDEVTFIGKPAPTLQPIADVIADVLQPVFIHARGTNQNPNGALLYALEPGVPAAARIHATNGLFLWKPIRADANTTNVISIRVSDNDTPPASVTQAFTITVRDYVEITAGAAVTGTGNRTNVFLQLACSAPLTNIGFKILFPAERLGEIDLENLLPASATTTADTSQAGEVVLTFAALPGQQLAGTQDLARLHFTVTAGQSSAFIPLQVSEVAAVRAQEGLAPTLLSNHGRVVAVGAQPLVELHSSTNARTLTLFGHTGVSYAVEHSTNVSSGWSDWSTITPENLIGTADVSGDSGNLIFYRARQGEFIPAVAASTAPTDRKSTIQAKKKKLAALKKFRKKLRNSAATPNPILP